VKERNFIELLQARWDEGKFVCVGLDSNITMVRQVNDHKLKSIRDGDDHLAVVEFNKRIVDATKDLVCAYKPNSAFYEALGSRGLWALEETIFYINEEAPEVPVILDFKRGDIGNTNAGYVIASQEADAVTVHPYLGQEAMKPFLDRKDKGVIVLVRTSNPGAGEFQDQLVVVGRQELDDAPALRQSAFGGTYFTPLYRMVAYNVSRHWDSNGNCAVVVGATYPYELEVVRKIVGDMPILIPGIGAQGGELEATVKAGANSKGQGMIINSSRGIIFASDGEDFAEAARAAAHQMHDDITAVLAA
jgi:orotidine-5'-phosphate decarboxylase